MIRAASRPEPRDWTVPELARQMRVNQNKVLRLIRSGELAAYNIAATTASRPKWRITSEAIASFQAARSATSTSGGAVRKAPRMQIPKDVIRFF
jgi:hypothetical protein